MEKELLLTRAESAVMSHDYPTAVRLYKELLRAEPGNITYLNELGSIFVKNGEDEKAIPYYEEIHTFDPKNIFAMTSLGAIYRRLKRYEKSIQILEKALDLGTDVPSVNYNLGFTYKEMGNFEDAIDAFESVIVSNPDDVLAYNHLGTIYHLQNDFQKSINTFKRGLNIDQNHPILNYNLAKVYEDSGNTNEAIKSYQLALRTRPGWLEAISDYSRLLVSCQKTKEAQDLVQQAIQLHPSDSELLYILGNIYLNQYDFSNASETFNRANQIKGNDIRILSGLTEALERGNKPEQALETVLNALELDPLNKDIRKQYVHTLLSNKDYDSAYETLETLHEEIGDYDAQVLDLFAQYYICRENQETAEEYFKKIRQVNPGYKNYMLEAAGRFAQIGDLNAAENLAKKYVEVRSDNPEAFNLLGKIYTQKGDSVAAKNAYNQSVSIFPNVEAKKAIDEIKIDVSQISGEQDFDLLNPGNVFEDVEETAPENETVPESETAEIESEVETEPESVPESEIDSVSQPEDEITTVLEEDNSEFDFGALGDDYTPVEKVSEEENFFNSLSDIENEMEDSEKDSEFVEPEPELETPVQAEEPEVTEPEPEAEEDAPVVAEESAAEKESVAKSEAMEKRMEDLISKSETLMTELKEMVAQKKEEVLVEEASVEEEDSANEEETDDAVEPIAQEEEPASEEPVYQEEPESDDFTFATVEGFLSPETAEAASDAVVLPLSDEPFLTVEDFISPESDMLGKIEKILNDEKMAKEYSEQIELFKTLKVLSAFLPESERNTFYSCKMRMMIEYLISKMSGKPGLLATANALIKSGTLGPQYDSQLEKECDEELSNDLILRVLKFMQKMTAYLPDRDLAKSMSLSADSILEQIELKNQQNQIFN